MKSLEYTSIVVTGSTIFLLLLYRITEISTSSPSHIEQVIDTADQYYEEARSATSDVDRLRLKAMALSLFRYASVSMRSDVLENIAGYSVGRRIKHIEQDMSRLRQSMTQTPTAV